MPGKAFQSHHIGAVRAEYCAQVGGLCGIPLWGGSGVRVDNIHISRAQPALCQGHAHGPRQAAAAGNGKGFAICAATKAQHFCQNARIALAGRIVIFKQQGRRAATGNQPVLPLVKRTRGRRCRGAHRKSPKAVKRAYRRPVDLLRSAADHAV